MSFRPTPLPPKRIWLADLAERLAPRSRRKAAKILGISPMSLSRLIRGTTFFSEKIVKRILEKSYRGI